MKRQTKQEAFGKLQVGDVVHGTVRTLTDFGAFVDLGGVDGLLHVSDMTYARGIKPSDVVSQDQADRSQDPQDQSRHAQDFAGAEATGAGPVDGGGGKV